MRAVTAVVWSARLGRSRLHFGSGSLAKLLELVDRLGSRRPLLVTDPGVRVALDLDSVRDRLSAGSVTAAIFDAVEENPTSEHVARGVEAAARHRTDLLVGVGGGSAMDAAKGINFVLTNGGSMEDYQGVGRAAAPMLPSIGVPTTAGTGSEAQSFALIARPDDHRKMACGDPKAQFHEVILDPDLLRTVPRAVAFAAGIDAAAHALESHVCRRANPISRLYSAEAWQLVEGSLADALADPGSAQAAGTLLLGAHLAGAAIEQSMLGAAHACANPLTAEFGLVHGLAVGLMLPAVIRFNTHEAQDRYHGLAPSAVDLESRVARLWSLGGHSARLRDHGIPHEALPRLAVAAAEQWTAGFNPRTVGAHEMLDLYEQTY